MDRRETPEYPTVSHHTTTTPRIELRGFANRVANAAGVPAYGLVAGAGGLAIALVAKTTLESFARTHNLYLIV